MTACRTRRSGRVVRRLLTGAGFLRRICDGFSSGVSERLSCRVSNGSSCRVFFALVYATFGYHRSVIYGDKTIIRKN